MIGIHIQLDDLHAGTIQEIHCVFIHPIGEMVNQADNAGVDQGFGAVDTREMGDITGAVPGRYPVKRRLDDGVGLGVDRAHAVPLHQQMPDLVAVGLPRKRAIESGGQDAFVAHQHTTHQGTIASAALGNRESDFHKIGIPIRSHENNHSIFLKKQQEGVEKQVVFNNWLRNQHNKLKLYLISYHCVGATTEGCPG